MRANEPLVGGGYIINMYRHANIEYNIETYLHCGMFCNHSTVLDMGFFLFLTCLKNVWEYNLIHSIICFIILITVT